MLPSVNDASEHGSEHKSEESIEGGRFREKSLVRDSHDGQGYDINNDRAQRNLEEGQILGVEPQAEDIIHGAVKSHTIANTRAGRMVQPRSITAALFG